MKPVMIDLLLFISILLLIFSTSWLFIRLKGEIQYLLEQFKNLYKKYDAVNRSSELINSSQKPADVLNIITIELAKILGNCTTGVIIFKGGEIVTIASGTEAFNKWFKRVNLNIIDLNEFWQNINANKLLEIKTPANPISVQSAIFMPIIIKEKAVGVLAVLSLDKPRVFTEEEKKYIKLTASQSSVVVENINHIDIEKTYKEEILGINAITELGLLSLSSKDLMEIFVNKFAIVTKSKCAILFMRTLKTNDYIVSGTCGLDFKQEAQLINDNKELLDNVFSSGKTFSTNKQVGLALKSIEEVFGCIVFYKEHVGEAELRHYENLAQKAAIIFEKAKINESSKAIINELSAISYIGNVILSTPRLDDVLNLISKSICEIMDAKGGTLRLLKNKEGQEDKIELCVSYGVSAKLMNEDKERNFTITERQVIKTLQIQDVRDIEKSEYRMFKQLNMEGIKSLVCIPLLAKNKVIGILTLYFRYQREFTESDKKIMLIFTSHTAIAIENTRLFKSWKTMYLNVIKSFATALDGKDTYTKGHSEVVLKYATAIAWEMKLQESEIELLQYSAILHDIGKIGIADDILKKPAKLTKEEFEIIKKHPAIGANILESIEEFKEVAKIVLHHHEAFGGQGYPDGLRKEEIPLLSRIITVADSFEAMTSDRPYRKALEYVVAIKELEANKNTQFDPYIVDVFKKVIAKQKE